MRPRTRVKICGITSLSDGIAAAEAGADAVGFVFYEKSPRAVDAGEARRMALALPPFVCRVGLFMDASPERVARVLREVPLDLLQFHGDECPADCGVHGRPFIKAVAMTAGMDVAGYTSAYPDAAGFLLDSHGAGQAGGTGRTFDWDAVPEGLDRPLILAGGLSPANVAQAIARVRPWGVDVSSGVESAPGIKDPALMAAFISEVRRVDSD